VWLDPSRPPGPGGDSLVAFDVIARRAPARAVGVGLAYDDDYGGRAWLGVADRGRLRGTTQVALAGEAGRYRQELALTARSPRRAMTRRVPFLVSARVAHEDVRRWFDGVELPTSSVVAADLFAGTPLQVGVVRAEVGPTAGWWRQRAEDARAVVGARVVVERAGDAPTAARLEAEANARFRYARADVGRTFALGAVALTPFASAAEGRGLPLHRAIMLGGWEGFPGLRVGEWRGARTLLAGVTARRELTGPVALRVTLAAGAAGDPTGWPPRTPAHGEGWLAGARVGLEAATPLGPVRVEEGVNTAGGQALFVRIGRWF
jgi:hypothetical protein